MQLSDVQFAALIGAAATITAAWINSRTPKKEVDKPSKKKNSNMSVLALGFALTSLFIGVFSFTETLNQQVIVKKKMIEINTVTTDGVQTKGEGIHEIYLAANSPSNGTIKEVKNACPTNRTPIAAWTEVITTKSDNNLYAGRDALYAINAEVEGDKVFMHLRGQKNAEAYAYVQVLVLCSRLE